jgi:hypothetical protein
MTQSYTASDIEVLTGLEPVRRRPGMYTDTRNPNHLAHEVIDNSVDEAWAGHCRLIAVTLHKDGSLEVEDDGRGMPVDIHPQEKMPGVELILTRLHAGGKFSDKAYQQAGGLHGVGVSVVNALSKNLECWVRRDGREYNISFKAGRAVSKLEEVGTVKRGVTGTTLRFWPDPKFFDSPISRCRACGTCCAPRPCCAPACASGSRSRPAARSRSGSTPATCPTTSSSSSAGGDAAGRALRRRLKGGTRRPSGRSAGRRTLRPRSPRATST